MPLYMICTQPSRDERTNNASSAYGREEPICQEMLLIGKEVYLA